MTKIKENWIYILYALFPIINLITSLMTRFLDFPLTLGLMVRIAFLLYFIFYIFFISKSKYKKKSIIYLIICIIYGIIHCLVASDITNIRSLYVTFNHMFKFFYFPILIVGMILYYSEHKFDSQKWNKILLINLITYLILLLIPIITQSYFYSYRVELEGFNGWFYAANEVGTICLILFSSSFKLLEKSNIKYLIVFTLSCLLISLILTKVANYGMIIITVYTFLIYLFSSKEKIKKLIMLVSVIICTLCVFNANNLFELLDREESTNPVTPVVPEEPIPPTIPNKPNEQPTIIDKLLSSRNIYLEENLEIYKNSSLENKLFGIGFEEDAQQNDKLIEMDAFDILIRSGLIGLLIIIAPFIFLIIKGVVRIKKHEIENYPNLIADSLLIGLSLGISTISGHVLGAPAVTSYLAIIALLIFFNKKDRTENEKN